MLASQMPSGTDCSAAVLNEELNEANEGAKNSIQWDFEPCHLLEIVNDLKNHREINNLFCRTVVVF